MIINKLPESFVIKNTDNPLWIKFIKWLNNTYGTLCTGVAGYYGHSKFKNSIQFADRIDWFNDTPILITLEEWDEAVNGFKLPKKWCVKVTDDNKKTLDAWKIL